MRRLLVSAAAGLACLFASAMPAFAEDGDEARANRSEADIGEQFTMTLTVVAPPEAAVELDPTNPSWAGVDIVRVTSQESVVVNGQSLHTFEVVVAGFLPLIGQIQPAVVVIEGGTGTPRLLPAVPLSVFSTLPADAPLELSPIPEAVSIDGAESPFLKPAIFGGGAVAVLAIAGVIYWVGRKLAARVPDALPEGEAPLLLPDLDHAERLIDIDPVGAYRTLAATVRNVITERYGVPANAMTAREIQGKMESSGVDRWQARLVSGLLQECEAVVYAGYLPAAERRRADLSMAQQIIDGAAP